jgi:class 3 adenylate cyclase/predicted ATPase
MSELGGWLKEHGLEAYLQIFSDNDIDFDILQELNDQDLKELGLSLGHRRKLLRALSECRSATRLAAPSEDVHVTTSISRDQEAAASLPEAVSKIRTEPERRHLTVMFCDLVGSTALSTRLDPEDLSAVIGKYQSWCNKIVGGFGGFVAKYMGDGVLVYFGYPRAHEDDAERAVHAALRLIEQCKTLQLSPNLVPMVRIGIASGLVVVGELVGEGMAQEQTVVGETPNLAARLQTLADPQAVVIAQETHRLLGEVFQYADLGTQDLKGFAQPVHAYRVVGVKSAESRFEATRSAILTPFVGRDTEIAMLLERWQQAKDGEGQAFLLCGEPGMGKSRLTQVLHQQIASEHHSRLRYQCSPYYSNTSLYPFIDQMERVAHFESSDDANIKLDKLEQLLATTQASAEHLALFAAMLSISTGGRYPALEMSPQRQKERLIEALTAQVLELSKHLPVLLLFEDAHWSDPTSIEVLNAVIEHMQRSRILAVITHRPEFVSAWSRHTHVTNHTIGRLPRRLGAAMVQRVTGDKPLPAEVISQIVAKTDGIPLFVEELTKTVIDSGLLADKGDHYELDGPLPTLAIPATLHDSLMARLDRLAPVKETAQIGAALGREFSFELISTISPLGDNELSDALGQLIRSELIYARGLRPHTMYTFKHALVQDAAYESLLKARRQQLHLKIAKTFETRFQTIAETEPELIAHHYTAAGLASPAISYWAKAGKKAMQNSAYIEAVAHIRKGLALVQSLPESANRLEQELMLLNLLVTPLMYTRGYAASEVHEVYDRSHQLCENIGEGVHIFQARCGVSTYHMVRGELDQALRLSRQMLALAETQREEGAIIEAHRLNALNTHYGGQFRKSVAHSERVRELFDPSCHRPLALIYGQDHLVSSCVLTAQALAALGYPDQARRWRLRALAEAEQTNHYFSRAYARSMSLTTLQYLRDKTVARQAMEEATAYATEQSIVFWLLYAKLFHGWILLEEERPDEAVTVLREAIAAYRVTGSEVQVPQAMTHLAQALARTGATGEALDVLGKALAQTDEGGERDYEAEGYRVKGDILLNSDGKDREGAEVAYVKSIEVARAQDSKLFELRASTSLARLWHYNGKTEKALTLLHQIYGWFTEGFEEVDLKDAQAAMNEFKLSVMTQGG